MARSRSHRCDVAMIAFGSLAATLTLLATSSASAQNEHGTPRAATMAPRLHLRGSMTGGGEARLETDEGRADDDLARGFGGSAEIEVPIAPILSFGGSTTVTAWQVDLEDNAGLDRNIVVDFDLVPRLRLPFAGTATHGALYIGVPVGLSVGILNDTYAEAVDALGGDLSPGIGFHVGGRLGGQIFVTPGFGFVLEGGFDYRAIGHRLELATNDDDFLLRTIHFTGQAGLVFAM